MDATLLVLFSLIFSSGQKYSLCLVDLNNKYGRNAVYVSLAERNYIRLVKGAYPVLEISFYRYSSILINLTLTIWLRPPYCTLP
jgi:hypothetical protein